MAPYTLVVARADGRLTHQLLPEEKGPQDACGVFGVWASGEEVAKLAYFALYALQHRGQEAAGIAVSDGASVLVYKDLGLVSQVFDEATLNTLKGHIAVGHTRYSTTGSTTWENAQPAFRTTRAGTGLALGHNGNLVNTAELAVEAERAGLLRGAIHDRLRSGYRAPRRPPGRLARAGGTRRAADPARGVLLRVHGRAHPLCRS